MNVQELIKNQLKTVMVSGGDGDKLKSAIILHKNFYYDYVALEYVIMNHIAKKLGVKYEYIEQILFEDADKIYDRIEVKIITNEKTQHRYFYFDITEVFKKSILKYIY